MISNSIKLLAITALVLGTATGAYACGDKDKGADAQASYSSAQGSSCCAAKGAMADASKGDACRAGHSSTMAAADGCPAHMGAKMASGDHCAAGKAAMAAGGCEYGDNVVIMAGGACAAGAREADYAFSVKDAECMGTGAAVARAIKAVPGVAAVTVDYEHHMAYVCADARTAGSKTIEKSLKKAGFAQVKFVNADKSNCSKSHGKVEA